MCALPVGIQGAIITSQDTFGPMSVPFVDGLTLDLFNPALGTLTSVTVEINGTLTALVTAENNAVVASAPVRVDAIVFGSINTAGVPGSLAPAAAFLGSVATDFLDNPNGVAGSGPDFSGFGGAISANVVDSASSAVPAVLALFAGPGTFNVGLVGFGAWGVQGLTDSTVNVSQFAGFGSVKVIYEYTHMPEPSHYVMLGGLGLVGFAAVRRFRR